MSQTRSIVANDLSESEGREILLIQKILSVEEISWGQKPENSSFMRFSAQLLDSDGASIPGLSTEMEFRQHPRFDDCKYTFSIYKFVVGGRRRAYQLEVVPVEDKSHSDSNCKLYGPHEHIGSTVSEVRIGSLGCKDHEKWFREYLSRANISFWGRYVGPFDGRLI